MSRIMRALTESELQTHARQLLKRDLNESELRWAQTIIDQAGPEFMKGVVKAAVEQNRHRAWV